MLTWMTFKRDDCSSAVEEEKFTVITISWQNAFGKEEWVSIAKKKNNLYSFSLIYIFDKLQICHHLLSPSISGDQTSVSLSWFVSCSWIQTTAQVKPFRRLMAPLINWFCFFMGRKLYCLCLLACHLLQKQILQCLYIISSEILFSHDRQINLPTM